MVGVGVPVQVPFATVRVSPTWAVPVMAGGTVLTGRAPATADVAALVLATLPAMLRAVARRVITLPASAGVRTCVVALAPGMTTPAASHSRRIDGVGRPAHVPFVPVRVCPTVAVPVMAGSTEFVGLAGAPPNSSAKPSRLA